jgi:translocation and assembly module TamB
MHTVVVIPDAQGQPLDPIGPPTDMRYGPKPAVAARPTSEPTQKAPPPHPLLVAKVELVDVAVESSDARGVVAGTVEVSLGAAQVGGSSLGVVGDLHAEHGTVMLFDRRYQLDRAAMQFDGSIDPRLDVRIVYDFPDVTTMTEIHGRLSKPELALSSEPGVYSQGELLGFLLGGEPNGDPSQTQSASSKVSGAGVGLVANKIGGVFKKALPVDIDVLKYDAATASNSAAITVGKWLTHTLFLAYRQHLEVRPDENTVEGNAEYYIRPRLMLLGTAGDRGYDGLDLLWRKRW